MNNLMILELSFFFFITALWVNALGCSLLVSLASLICLILLPVMFGKWNLKRIFVLTVMEKVISLFIQLAILEKILFEPVYVSNYSSREACKMVCWCPGSLWGMSFVSFAALAFLWPVLVLNYTVISFAMRLKCMYMICCCFKIHLSGRSYVGGCFSSPIATCFWYSTLIWSLLSNIPIVL